MKTVECLVIESDDVFTLPDGTTIHNEKAEAAILSARLVIKDGVVIKDREFISWPNDSDQPRPAGG